MNSESIFINDDFVEKIKSKCGLINNSDIRCKTASGVFASNVAKMFFESDEFDCDSGIHNLPEIISDIEISDVYLKNTYIDVRIYFKENDLCVPSELFKRNLLPTAFMFIKVSEDLSGAQVTGFITPGDINTQKEINGYYPVSESSLQSYYDIESLLTYDDDADVTNEDRIMVYDFLDNKLPDKDNFYRRLFKSEELRHGLIDAANAKHKYDAMPEINFEEASGHNEAGMASTLDLSDDIAQDLSLADEDAALDSIDLELQDTDTDLSEMEADNETLDEFDLDAPVEELDSLEGEAEDLGIDVPSRKTEDDELNSDDSDDMNLNGFDGLESLDTDNIGFIQESDAANEPLSYSNNSENLELEENNEVESFESNEEITLDFADENDSENNDETEDLVPDDNQSDDNSEYTEIEQTDEDNMDSQYSTEVTPSLNSYEISDEHSDGQTLEQGTLEIEDGSEEGQNIDDTNNEPSEHDSKTAKITSSDAEIEENENIDNLFSGSNAEVGEGTYETQPAAKKKSIVPVLGLVAVVAGLGYFAYTKLNSSQVPQQDMSNTIETNIPAPEQTKSEDTMPIETVENVAKDKSANEGTAVSIPAIENNLDASVLVSNLSISWEVPAAYTNNSSAKRYFAKIGKIIQVNLKAELLLLSKPPINNRVVLEIEYNKTSGDYTVKGFTVSSGEKLVDDIIMNTVKNVLKMNLNIDTSSFGEIPGNPSLIIKL